MQIVPKSIRMPSIYLKNVRNFSEFHKKSIQITGIHTFPCMSTPLSFRANNHPTFSTIIKYITSTSVELNLYLAHYIRRLKVVIRNRHHTIILTDISDSLVKLGHSVLRVVNIKKPNGHYHFYMLNWRLTTIIMTFLK